MLMFDASSKTMGQSTCLPSSDLSEGWVLPGGQPRAETVSENFAFSFEERMAYLKKYGSHCMSFSTLQPGMKFFDVPGVGFIAYMRKWGSQMVLSDPVCHEDDREMLIGRFLATFKHTGFVQITEPVAKLMYERFGYYATQFGVETIVDLENWSLSGKKKQILRTSLNQSRKNGIVIRECREETRHHALSRQWMTTRKIRNREIGFLIRPMVMDHEEDTRKFFAYQNDELVGFAFFDPIYRDGKIVSYVPNISRFSQNFRQGIFYSLMAHAMETFKAEGISYLNLGLSILVLDDDDKPSEGRLLKNIERLIYRYGNFIYNFKGIAFTKSRFCGTTNKFYCAHRWPLPAIKLISMFKLSNVF